MPKSKSFASIEAVTKDRAKALVAAGLQRAVLEYGLDTVASAAVCTPRCVQKALAHETLPETHTLINMLRLDPTILFELLAAMGLKLVPHDIEISEDMETLLMLSGAMTEFIRALEDNRRDHQETLKLAKLFRPLIPRMAALVEEADKLKNGRHLGLVA